MQRCPAYQRGRGAERAVSREHQHLPLLPPERLHLPTHRGRGCVVKHHSPFNCDDNGCVCHVTELAEHEHHWHWASFGRVCCVCNEAQARNVDDHSDEITCARCHSTPLVYATINGKRYCHADERSCYTEALYDDEHAPWRNGPLPHLDSVPYIQGASRWDADE